jgi:nitrogen fixation NifU-like protein
MSDLKDLYQEVIIDHSRHPRNFYRMEDADRSAEGHNPLCGDRVTLYLKFEDSVLKKVSFEGSGCAISTASASMLADVLEGKTLEEAEAVLREFHRMLTGRCEGLPDVETLGKLAAFSGVVEFPTRVKCATLAWHTLEAAMEGQGRKVRTE